MHSGPAHVPQKSPPGLRRTLKGQLEVNRVVSPKLERVPRRSDRLRAVGTGNVDPALEMPGMDLCKKEVSEGEGEDHGLLEHMASKRRKTTAAV